MTDHGRTANILVIANRTCECPRSTDIAARARRARTWLVVAPRSNSRVRHWVSDSEVRGPVGLTSVWRRR